MLIDTHAHLYWDSFKEDLGEVLKRAFENKVTTIINVGVDLELSKTALEQVKNKLNKFPGIKAYSTIGIHPHEALRYAQDFDGELSRTGKLFEDIVELEKIYLSDPDKVVAVGECGLDFFFETNLYPTTLTPEKQKELQRNLFQAQIDLAKKLNLPLIVHSRDDRSQDPENSEAWDEILSLVSTHPTILHCYSGLLKTTQKVLSSPNLVVSFAGTLTYPKNEYLREAVKLIPLDRIVLETDCPFLPPQSKRGQRNEPANVKEVAQLIAELKSVDLETVEIQTTKNASKILAL